MKHKIWAMGSMLIISMLFYTCTLFKPNNITQSKDPYPKRVFNAHPNSDYLSPEESMKTFNLPPGYHLELVASEPMIKEPVAIAWDGNARMYVAEMRSYMQDADATGERANVSRISLLEDTNDDGKMDKSTIFIDSLMLPRMILCINNELLVNETGTITINAYKDTDGNGKADQKRIVYENPDYSPGDANMEHQRSGLDWNLDNWIYMTYERARMRYKDGILMADTMTSGGGQWGLTHDNYGRLFYSSAGGETPIQRFQINPAYGSLDFKDQISDEFNAVWPIITTPDVQGGLPRLRPDTTLNHFTACSGQSIFRGDALPADLVGDYIVCEPVGRLIRRAKLINLKGKTIAQNVYYKQEFIASSDMNFRPVNSYTGPDGNLYIVDMHRGIIQQGTWTPPGSFLRKVIDKMGFAKNTGHGRIYRLVHDGQKPGPKPDILNASPAKLVTYLDHPNGWWRDNAQRQLIVLGDKSVVPALKEMAAGKQSSLPAPPSSLGRIHALWTLEGLDAADKDILLTAMNDSDAQVRKAAIWISEPFIKENDAQVLAKLAALKMDPSYDVRTQLLLSLSVAKGDKVRSIADKLLAQNQDNEMMVATAGALERNINTKTYGRRLGSLSADNRNQVLKGSAIFKALCAECHGSDAKGLASGVAPPLLGSEPLTSDKKMAIRILLNGLSGPIEGKSYPGNLMPPMGANSDKWIANVLSYARFEFSERRDGQNGFSPFVSPEEVAKLRAESAGRGSFKPWTIDELRKAE